jgi:uncharacterized paraquat-inducible protein A
MCIVVKRTDGNQRSSETQKPSGMTSSSDTTRCKHCQGTVEFEIQSAGQETECQHCGKTFTLPTKQEIAWKARLTIAAINDLSWTVREEKQ